jgi:hypothetical protein
MPEPIVTLEQKDDKKVFTPTHYKDEETQNYAQSLIQQINKDLEKREQASLVTNGISYSKAYEYNQKKAVNYAPPRNPKDDREVSFGIIHEKIISFSAVFLKYVWKRQVKCYNEKGELIKNLGEVYDLAIEHSYQLEHLKKKIALIYWETFTQGNTFVLEDWEVKLETKPKAFYTDLEGNRVEVTPDLMDYSYEFLEGLSYEKGEEVQKRRAVSRILDGRQVIWGNPEIEEVQDQPRFTLEESYSRNDAESIFGSLSQWKNVPTTAENVNSVTGGSNLTLFNTERLTDPNDVVIVHRVMDKENNRFNIFVNGLMMLPKETPMTVFYPRGNYPITNIPAERLKGSIYARSIPAKTKFNADFIDWALKMLANKFEQGIDPAIFSKGKYTLTRNMFRAGQVTHGVSTADFERADPENKGITAPEFSFVSMIKEIIQTQTVNATTSGELSNNATATEIGIAESNQRDKLGYMLDGLMNGFMDMALRRAETVEAKYTMKKSETVVNGKTIPVYQNFTVSTGGVDHTVEFNDAVGGETYDHEAKKDELFTKAFKNKEKGLSTEYWLINPKIMCEGKTTVIIEIMPEKVKDSALMMMQMWEEFGNLMKMFGDEVNRETLKKEYLNVSGRPDDMFLSAQVKQLDQQLASQDPNAVRKGAPTVAQTVATDAMSK